MFSNCHKLRLQFSAARMILLHVFAFQSFAIAQLAPNTQAPQPLNASVSDIGTTFIFSPPPICSGCIETELGFLSLQDGRYLPGVITLAPFSDKTDFSVLVNLLDSESPQNHRTTQFGNRFDFILRQKVAQKGGFELTLAPRGSLLVRRVDGGRAGAAAAPQFAWGKNLIVANFTWTAGIAVSAANPRTDYQGAFDYYRTLDHRGTSVAFGLQHEDSDGDHTVGIEQALVLPFRNGQVELEAAQLDLNTQPEFQFQTRVIVNWGKFLARHPRKSRSTP